MGAKGVIPFFSSTRDGFAMNRAHPHKAIYLFLTAVTLVVYAQTGTFQFTNFDDHFFVSENPVVLGGVTAANIAWAFTTVTASTWQPLTWLTHMLDCQLFGTWAGGHHLVNVLIHIVNSLLLYYVLRLYTKAVWRSALVATLFAIHPLHVESVAWVSERRDVLCALWWLLAMWRYAVWRERRGGRHYLLFVVCFAAGLMSKPMVVTLPVVLMLCDVWPLRRITVTGLADGWRQRQGIGRLLGEKVPLFALALLSATITMRAEVGSLGSLANYPLSMRVGNALLSYAKYLVNTIWPTGLIPFYPYPEHLPVGALAGATLLLVAISTFCLWQRNSQPYLLWGWVWYVVTLLPVIGLIQQGAFAMADRYTYLPLIGVFVMVVWGGARLIEGCAFWRPAWSCALTGGIIVVLSGVAFRQTGYWQDTLTLFTHTLDVAPDNYKALLQLGAYSRDVGELDQAEGYFAHVLRRYPDNREAITNLGDVYDRMGRPEQAIRYFLQSLRLDPTDAQVYTNLGVVMARQGDPKTAADYFEKALALRPADNKARMNLGGALYLQKRFSEAAKQFQEVVHADPGSADGYNGLGLVAMEQGDLANAIRSFQEALRIDPSFQHAKENLQAAVARQGGGR